MSKSKPSVPALATHALVGLSAAIVLRLSLGDGYLAFVRPSMRWVLVISAVVLIGLTAVDALRIYRAQHDHDHDHGHDHGPHRLRPALYLLAPVLCAFAIAPQPLGAFAVSRSQTVSAAASPFPPLEPGATAELTLLEFNQRALEPDGATLRGRRIRMTGFVVAGADLRIARFRVACCAADGQAAVARLTGVDGPPAADSWVTVEGTFDGWRDEVPDVAVEDLRVIEAPTDPYEAS